ncbi:MAG: quercetin 2,3-dioxygenase [Acidobacteria bacterium]|nr:MAG: quercetin 2,3-dioxygenase [Acidobacteriota bacterium]
MITLRRAAERGRFDFGWLDTRHTFSFGEYYDPEHMGFRQLRVINEDRVAPGEGFPTHGHRDMEILSYVLEGGLQHRDSLGTGSVIRPGDVQRMSAGTGVTHSEFNASRAEPVHFLQIWILPERRSLPPGYEQKAFPESERRGSLRLIASGDARQGSLTIHQDVDVYSGLLAPGETVRHPLRPGRHAWVQIARGVVGLDGQTLAAGDGAALSDETAVDLAAREDSEVLVFDLG